MPDKKRREDGSEQARKKFTAKEDKVLTTDDPIPKGSALWRALVGWNVTGGKQK
jgi:hypothetical protein